VIHQNNLSRLVQDFQIIIRNLEKHETIDMQKLKYMLKVHGKNELVVKDYKKYLSSNVVMDRTLKIATWNAIGFAKHPQEIKTFIFSQNIDILCS
jgi:hypothetical protein